MPRCFAHADAEALDGVPASTTLSDGRSRTSHAVTGASFMKRIAAAARQVIERPLDFVIGIDAYARGLMLGNKLVGDRLARVALLHADHQALRSGSRSVGSRQPCIKASRNPASQ